MEQDVAEYGQITQSFFDLLSNQKNTIIKQSKILDDKVKIGLDNRIDFQYISELIPDNAKILDLGCEEGNLIDRLISRGISSSLGVEIDQANVIECIKKGIKVIHSDLDSRLEKFEDKKFDVAILSQTLQSIKMSREY